VFQVPVLMNSIGLISLQGRDIHENFN